MDKNDMDRISGLPDELLVRILSFVPTKVGVSTSILSKRWEFLWMWLPKLEFVGRRDSPPALRDFIDKNLPLHRAPVIESLRLDFYGIKPEDIKRWVEISVSRYVRELEISYDSDSENIFPSSFYTCTSLVILKLSDVTLMDVHSLACLPSLKTLKLFGVTLMDVPSMVSLPSLKTLELDNVIYVNDESLQRLLSIFPLLEDLSVHFRGEEHDIGEFTVIVPSLQSLSLFIDTPLMYVIDTPSLKFFKLKHWTYRGQCSEIKNMPKLREAYIDAILPPLGVVIRSITSVKRLTLCFSEIDVDGDGFVFNQLEHLKLCVCNQESSNLLGLLLKDSPNLRVLDIFLMEGHETNECNNMVRWNQPSPVPECLLSSLQIFNWSRYFGRPQERDIAVYILKNARHLKTATVLADTVEYDVPNLKMIKELALSSRASSTCELVFVEDHTGS